MRTFLMLSPATKMQKHGESIEKVGSLYYGR